MFDKIKKFFTSRVKTNESQFIVDLNDLKKIRSEFSEQVVVLRIEEINKDICRHKIDLKVMALLYDICLDYADKNNYTFLSVNFIPFIGTYVTFKTKN